MKQMLALKVDHPAPPLDHILTNTTVLLCRLRPPFVSKYSQATPLLGRETVVSILLHRLVQLGQQSMEVIVGMPTLQ